MAIWFSEGSMQGREAFLYADFDSDMGEALVQFGQDNHVKKGTKCLCIETREVKFLNSLGEWK